MENGDILGLMSSCLRKGWCHLEVAIHSKCAKIICKLKPNIEQLWGLGSIGITREVMSPSEVTAADRVKS